MEIEHLDDAGAFLQEAAPLLLEDEARHNLILGLAAIVRDDPAVYPQRRLWLVREDGEVVAAALRTPPHNLVLAQPRSEAALDALVTGIAGEALPGVVGAVPEVDGFAERWARRRGVATRRAMEQGVLALEHVQSVPYPAGGPRAAGEADRPLALRWWHDFAVEALGERAGSERVEQAVDHRLRGGDAGILLWTDAGDVVSLAAYGGPTPSGIRIGPVYTPPERRGRGYATALVAELSQRLLDGGRRFCFLYTDLSNPTANAIYERIGYVRVCDSAEISFGQPGV